MICVASPPKDLGILKLYIRGQFSMRTVEDLYWIVYFEALEPIISSIKSFFDQPQQTKKTSKKRWNCN